MRLRLITGFVVTAALMAVGGGTGAAAPFPSEIVLPGATSAEGIAVGRGSTFFAGDLLGGDIFKGDLRSGAVSRVFDATDGRMAVGMKVDRTGKLLFVAGGMTGKGFVYDTTTGAELAAVPLRPAPAFINDVALTRDAAWFTDSAAPTLFRVPIGPNGQIGDAVPLPLSGPAADTSGEFNLNGIAASPDGSMLLVAHSTLNSIIRVDPVTGASQTVEGVDVSTPDGILYEAGTLWVVENFANQISSFRLNADFTSGTPLGVVTSPLFQIPTTVARHGSRLAAVNAKFDTGFPPTADEYEVIVV